MKNNKQTVTAHFPGIGYVEISKDRAVQILRLQKLLSERKSNELLTK
jgi:hypothetical protein